MATPTNHFKIGLFVILAVAAAIAIANVLAAPRIEKKTVDYHIYFNESVQGL